MKILTIGNSFSQDAMAYLHDLSASAGKDVETLNLFIGGCSLETHINNLNGNKDAYVFEWNGVWDDSKLSSIQNALSARDWDYISFQQASHDSGRKETYFPYINQLADTVHHACPNAKLLIHETWAYEVDSNHNSFVNYNHDQQEMHNRLTECYEEAAKAIHAYRMIPTGAVIAALREHSEFNVPSGGESLCRDGYHLSLSYGRYAAAATWYECLIGDIQTNSYLPSIEGLEPAKIDLIKRTIQTVCKNG